MKINLKASWLSGLLWISFLTGCSTIPAPQTSLNERLQFNEEVAERYPVDQEWWKAYQDEQLNQLVTTALVNNLDLAKSAISVNKALYQAHLVAANLVPSFSGSTSAATRENVKTSAPATRNFGAELGISYEVDLWRKLADSASAREWELHATTQDQEATRLALINNVVDAYYQLAYLHQAIQMTEQMRETNQRIAQHTETKFKAGKVDAQEPIQAKQSVLNLQSNLLDLQAQQKTAEQTLRDLLNLKPSDPLQLRYSDLAKVNLPAIQLEVPLSVLANRPDLRAAEYRLQSAFKEARATQKSWYPAITLGGALSSNSNRIGSALNVPFAAGNLGISLPFLDWNRVKWNVKISEADYQNAQLNFEQTLTTALNEVDTYYETYRKKVALSKTAKQKHQLDVKNSRYYQTRYQQGANEISDWLSALQTAMTSKLSVLHNQYQLIQQTNQIYKAMAGRYSQNTYN